MNNKPPITSLFLIIASLFFGCHRPVKEEIKNNGSAPVASSGQKYIVDKKETVITWKGSMQIASIEEHVGFVYISKGELMIEKDQLVGGTVEIDMHSIEYKDKCI